MSTGGLYSFDPTKGETPETLKRRRQIAEALMGGGGAAPTTIGGGLSSFGRSIASALINKGIARQEAAGQASAGRDFASLVAPAPLPDDTLSGGGGTDTLSGSGGGLPDVAAMEAEIRRVAPKYGIDPDTAVAVAKSEGLQPGTWQSNVMGKSGRETSYGPYQLLVGGGLGDEFQKTTGLNAADPSTWKQNIDFSLGQAAKQGWTPWHGAANTGIGARQGIGGAPAVTAALTGGGGTETLAGGAGGDRFDFTPFATGGAAARPDSFSGLQPAMSSGLGAMISSAPADIQSELQVLSGYRSPETQERLWQNALKKYGSASAARKWVAPPGRSQHGAGNAIDWKFASKRARDWAHENAAQYGFSFPLGNEPWHMEVAGARGKGPPVQQNASGIGRPLDSTGGGAGGVGVPAVAGQGQGGIPAVMEALTGAAPQQEAVSAADPATVAALVGADPAAKDDMLGQNVSVPAFRPAGGSTPYYNPLGADQAWQAGSPSPPDPNMRPAIAPVAAPAAPPVAATAPAAPGVAPVARALGVDPLPQTSAMPGVGGVQGAGHESLSPSAQAVSQALSGGGGTDALAGGGGRGLFERIFRGGTRTPAAVAGGGGGVPSAAAPGSETAALPGTEPVSDTGTPAAGGFSPQAQNAIRVLTNPWANEGQQAVAKTILDQEIAQADPLHQAQLAKIKYDLAVSQARDPIDIAKAKTELERLQTPTKLLTLDEAKAAGLPDYGRWSRDDDGTYKLVEGTKPEAFRNATPEEAAAHGAATGQVGPNGQFHPDTVPPDMTLQRDGTGEYRLVPKSEAGPTFEQTTAFRKELLSQQGQIRFRTTAPQLASMSAAINEPTAMSDLDFVYGMAQIFDPTSSVREGEMGMVITGQSVPESIIGRVMKMTEGGAELGVQGRRDLFAAVQRRVNQYYLQAEDEAKAYADIATKMKIPDSSTVIVPLPNMPSWPKMSREQYDALEPGTVFVDSKGRVVRKPMKPKG